MTAEQLNQHIDKFAPMWVDGKLIEPPKDKKITVFCQSQSMPNETGFIENVLWHEMGIHAFIAKSWILQTELDGLTN